MPSVVARVRRGMRAEDPPSARGPELVAADAGDGDRDLEQLPGKVSWHFGAKGPVALRPLVLLRVGDVDARQTSFYLAHAASRVTLAARRPVGDEDGDDDAAPVAARPLRTSARVR